jgi:ubiquinone/menaquinone biosynthesis C-methylase UbiE
MYKEYRRSASSVTASTPEEWTSRFAGARALGAYERLVFRLDHRFRLIRRQIKAGGRVLDAGSGGGEWVGFLNEHGYDAEGLDYSPELVNLVRRLYPKYRWNSGLIQALPYPDNTFAGVISWGVIEHDEAGPDAALREFHRVLAPGGVTIVTVPVDNDRQRRASVCDFPQAHAEADGHAFFQYFMTPDELAAYVQRAGFEVVDRGKQASVALAMLAPAWHARMTIRQRNLWNKLVRLGLSWHHGLRNMTYCIGRKRP